jgi:hypothetical protein
MARINTEVFISAHLEIICHQHTKAGVAIAMPAGRLAIIVHGQPWLPAAPAHFSHGLSVR